MRIYDGATLIDANFTVETNAGVQSILFASRGGSPVRNSQYAEGLDLVLQRLASLGATLTGAYVDSADTRRANLSPAERLLDPGPDRAYPIALNNDSDLQRLRFALGGSQAATARRPGARGRGNPTKQIRLEIALTQPLTDEQLARVLVAGGRLLVVALPRSANKNLEWGLENGVWGFPIPRFPSVEKDRVRDYKSLMVGDRVLILSGFSGGSPRVPFETWLGSGGSFNEFAECYLCEVNQTYYYDAVPFWPNEAVSAKSVYPHRIGIDPTPIGAVSLQPSVDLSTEALEAIHGSHVGGAQGRLIETAGSPRLQTLAEVTPVAPALKPSGAPKHAPPRRGVDPIRKKRVEARAMAMATARYEEDGWTVVDVSKTNEETDGTPYDLRCSKANSVRHVEVKGKSGLAVTVDVTANEREHAKTVAPDADSFLFVVEQIGLKTAKGEVRALGGVVRYDGPFLAEDARFTPTQYRYSVPVA